MRNQAPTPQAASCQKKRLSREDDATSLTTDCGQIKNLARLPLFQETLSDFAERLPR
jgi:hypothetical protein